SLTTLRRCTLSGNMASTAGALYFNDSLFGPYANYCLLVDGCTISGNQATGVVGGGSGGGALLPPLAGTQRFTVLNSTISGNKAQASGGGIAFGGGYGTLQVRNSTLTANTAVGGSGGGVVAIAGESVSIASSIVSGNAAPTGADVSFPGSVSVNF